MIAVNRRMWTRPFVLFTVLMMLKIYLSWYVIFGELSSLKPLAVALPSVWFCFGLIEWLASARKTIYYIIVNTVLTAIYFAAIMYHEYYGVIVTYRALQQANQVTQVKSSVFHLMHPYFLLVFIDVAVLLGLLIFSKRMRTWVKSGLRTRRPAALGLMLAAIAVCVANVASNRLILNEIRQAKEMGILNYEVYTIIADMSRKTPDPADVSQDAINRLKGIAAVGAGHYSSVAEGKNVIVIQMESFQNFLLNRKVGGMEITPRLNALLKESLYFPHVYQQAGQGNTSDAEFLLNTSFYIPSNGAASQKYAGKDLPSLPKLFKDKGYLALTFHTNDVEFWNRKELYASLGFDRYYDREFFGDKDIIEFGASDDVLVDKTAAEMARLQQGGQKFYANVITMTSHHPFVLPNEKLHLELPEAYAGTFVGDYLQAQNYADGALGEFFDKLKASGVWDNSVILLYGDHLGLPLYALTAEDKRLLKELNGREYSYRDMLNIPLIIKVPGQAAAVFNQVGGESDFMPTIANLVGLPLDNHIHFGQDLLNATSNLLPERYYLPSGSFINDEAVFIPGKGFEDGSTYSLGTVETLSGNDKYKRDFDNAQQLLRMSDSYVKNLPDR